MTIHNPLLALGSDIPFHLVRPEHVEPAIRQLIADAQARLQRVREMAADAGWDEGPAILDRATEPLDRAYGLVGHLRSVCYSDAWEAAYMAVTPAVTELYASIPMDEAIYAALSRYAETAEGRALTGPRRRFLDRTLDEMRRRGAELDAAGKQRLHEIAAALAHEATLFSQRVLRASQGWSLDLDDEARLAGIPASGRGMMAQLAAAAGVEGWRVNLAAPVVMAVLTYADDRALREQVWRAYNTRAASGELDNRDTIVRMLRLRREQAALLGYANFADYVLADRMAGSAAAAIDLVDRLEAAARPAFEEEARALDAFAAAAGAPVPLAPWDVGWHAERLRRARYDLDAEALRPYFPMPQVMDGLFGLLERLYGVQVRAIDIETWHPDVRTYAVEEGGKVLGTFHADFVPRPTKRDGAWMNALVTGDGSPHVGVICGNMTPPVGDRPALLTHVEVQTLFHEMGHLMHHLLTRASLYRQAGTNVAWDFVELPSQIMENWCWERTSLDLFARHVDTGERLPDDLFERMVAARTFRGASFLMRQLGLCRMDLVLHTDWDANAGEDVVAAARALMAPYSPVELPADFAMITAFSHLFADAVGYAAGYYSYQWAAVLDADAFARFREEGVFSAEVGHAFRRLIEAGDSIDPAELFHGFRGRDPEPDAHLARLGLQAA